MPEILMFLKAWPCFLQLKLLYYTCFVKKRVSNSPKPCNSSGVFGLGSQTCKILYNDAFPFLFLNSTHSKCLYTWYRLINTQMELMRDSWSLDILLDSCKESLQPVKTRVKAFLELHGMAMGYHLRTMVVVIC